jgi:peptide/nickel transport system substrate-binding protein
MMTRYLDETLFRAIQREQLSRRRLLRNAGIAGGLALGSAPLFTTGKTAAQEGTPSPAESPTPGGSLRLGFEANPDDLNPFTMTSLASILVTEQIYDTLFVFDQNLASQPNLCTGFEAPDDTTYVFRLEESASFSDGTPVTAEDVKFTLDGYRDPDIGARSWASVIDSVEALDEKTVQLNLSAPFAPIIGYLSWHYNPILSRAFYESNDGNLQALTLGSGPFILEEFIPDQTLRFVRNPGYWQEGLPLLDEMEWVILPDDQGRVAALRGGEIQSADFIDVQPVESFLDNPDWTVHQVSTLTHATTYINCAEGPLADVRVRQALSYAIDRDEILQTAALGYGQVSGYIPTPEKFWAVPVDELPTYHHDIEKARSLMAEAGYADGFDVTLRASPQYILDIANAQILQQQLKAIGVNVTIEQMEWGSLLDAWVNKEFELLNILLLGLPDPDGYTRGRYHSTSTSNRNQLFDPDLDALMDLARSTVDVEQRRALYAEIQLKLDDLTPNLFHYVIDAWLVWDSRYQGVTPLPNASAPYMKRIWIEGE